MFAFDKLVRFNTVVWFYFKNPFFISVNGNGLTSVELENGSSTQKFRAKSPPTSPLLLSVDEVIFARSRPIGFEEAGLRVMMSSTFAPKTRLRMACKVLIHEVYFSYLFH